MGNVIIHGRLGCRNQGIVCKISKGMEKVRSEALVLVLCSEWDPPGGCSGKCRSWAEPDGPSGEELRASIPIIGCAGTCIGRGV